MTTTRRMFLAGLIGVGVLAVTAGTASARDVWVEGKYRRDGVYVPGHYRNGRDPKPIDDTKPFSVPNDERSRGGVFGGSDSFGGDTLFGRGNKGGNPRGRRLGN
jgi:hypothetical protein